MDLEGKIEMELKSALEAATKRGASDVHFSVGRPIMLRIDGTLLQMDENVLLPADVESYIMPLLSESQKEDLFHRGEIDFAYSLQGIGRFRLNVFRQRGTYAAALRLLPFIIPTPEQLNLPQAIIEMTNKKRGLVLVTGPTGSGKSTTLASLINVINQKRANHIITLEDPIEYLHKSKKAIVNQREIGLDTMGYAPALRAALRQDPDIILLGEMRDLDTISTAVTAAETGHLVFSTLHTIGAASTIDRIVDVFPPHQQEQIKIQLATVLECVVSQQLLPTDDIEGGRCGAFEVMVANPAIRNLIREGKTFQITSMMQTNRKSGMITMDDALYELYITRRISASTALDFAQDYSYLSRKLG